jgi:hypothetical protein
VLKAEGASSWSRYDVVGWGEPVRINYWEPDSRWWGTAPRVLVDIRGAEAAALIPRVEAAIAHYPYDQHGDYRVWPGPNSNTFTASLLRAMPELEATLPSNAIGKDFRPAPYLGLTDSRTGIEASLFGILGIKLGWVEGLELNFLGLVTGLDLRHPAFKAPFAAMARVSRGRRWRTWARVSRHISDKESFAHDLQELGLVAVSTSLPRAPGARCSAALDQIAPSLHSLGKRRRPAQPCAQRMLGNRGEPSPVSCPAIAPEQPRITVAAAFYWTSHRKKDPPGGGAGRAALIGARGSGGAAPIGVSERGGSTWPLSKR